MWSSELNPYMPKLRKHEKTNIFCYKEDTGTLSKRYRLFYLHSLQGNTIFKAVLHVGHWALGVLCAGVVDLEALHVHTHVALLATSCCLLVAMSAPCLLGLRNNNMISAVKTTDCLNGGLAGFSTGGLASIFLQVGHSNRPPKTKMLDVPIFQLIQLQSIVHGCIEKVGKQR